jgi:hypothetical protein
MRLTGKLGRTETRCRLDDRMRFFSLPSYPVRPWDSLVFLPIGTGGKASGA